MSNPKTKFEVAARYGAFYGLATIISMLIFYVLQFNLKSSLPSLISYVLLVVFIFNGVKSYREHSLGGYISYSSSLGLGVLISIFGGFLIAGWTTILFSFIDPDIIEKILSSTQEELMKSGLSDADVEQALNMSKKFMTPGWLFFLSIVGSAMMGFIFSLFVSIFTRKEAPPFNH